MMVSGDKEAWREVEEIVRAAAPASFFGGCRVDWANAIAVGVVTVLASLRMVHSLIVLLFMFVCVCLCYFLEFFRHETTSPQTHL
jgi:hypothetical protein